MCVHGKSTSAFTQAGRKDCHGLRAIGAFFVLSLSIASLTFAANRATVGNVENTDARWLPWIGSWRLVSDTAGPRDEGAKSQFLLEILSGGDGKSITMKSTLDGKVLLEERIVADGTRQPLKDNKCTGWYTYSWSDSGKRLLFESESGCPGESSRSISGISIITGSRGWLDVQLLRSGEMQAVTIRRYELASGSSDDADRSIGPPIGTAWFQPDTALSVEEIIELSRKVYPGVIENVLFELRQSFTLNAKTLRRLADSEVPPRIVDLMVALSCPEKFTVQMNRISPIPRSETWKGEAYTGPPYLWLPFGYWSVYGPFSDWYWSPSFYSMYGYWGPGWGVSTGGNYDSHGGRDRSGGRLVNERGYSRVDPNPSGSRPRYAHPRSNSENSDRGYPSSPGHSSSGSTSSTPAPSSAGSGSSPSSGSSGGSAPSASPSGYHSGSDGGGTAKPRD